MKGYAINGLDKAFCRKVIDYAPVLDRNGKKQYDRYGYLIVHKVPEAVERNMAAITGYGSCDTIGSWWWVSTNGSRERLTQQVDCSHPDNVKTHVAIGRVAEVPKGIAVTDGWHRHGHAPATARRAW